MKEIKLKKYYYSLKMIDNERFIGSVIKYLDDREAKFIKYLGIYTFDSHTSRLYISFNKNYEIYVKNLKGTTELVIHKEHNNPTLKHSDKVDIVNLFGNIPENLRKAIIDALPDKMCAIESMDLLSNGCILVRSVIGYRKNGFNIFSRNGEYVYLIDLPEGINLEKIKFHKGVLSGIENREDIPVYHKFKIESLLEVF